MSKSPDYRRGYNRGYNARSSGKWPEHRPPEPPNGIVADIIAAALALRDGVDGELATLDPDDSFVERLGPLVDAVDEAMVRVSEWLSHEGTAE